MGSILCLSISATCQPQTITISRSTYESMRLRGVYLEEALDLCDSLHRVQGLELENWALLNQYNNTKIDSLQHDKEDCVVNYNTLSDNAEIKARKAKRRGFKNGAVIGFLLGVLGVLIL